MKRFYRGTALKVHSHKSCKKRLLEQTHRKLLFRYCGFLLVSLITPLSLLGHQREYTNHLTSSNPPYIPWFTGSVLPPSAVNAKPNHPIVAPYIGANLTYGNYDNSWNLKKTTPTWSLNPLVECLLGINDHIGIDIYASFISNFKKRRQATNLQDTIVLLGFQIASDTPNSWIPDIRLAFQETFPTGKYQKLNPKKLGIDSTGLGSFQSGFNLITQKLFSVKNHFLLLKWSLAYLFPAPTHVKKLNTYGGGSHTSGKVFPGQILTIYFSGEYSLNQRWGLAFDTSFEYQAESKFSGKAGTLPNGALCPVGLPSMTQITFAPQIEYNLSERSGFLFGIWASVLGKNSPAFATAFASYYIAF